MNITVLPTLVRPTFNFIILSFWACFFERARFEENVHNGKTIPDLFKMPYNIVCIVEENRLLVLDLIKYYAPITISYFGVRLITL